VAERGIVLTGGGALLRDIDKLLMEETGLPVVIADDPLTCVARGGGRILDSWTRWAQVTSDWSEVAGFGTSVGRPIYGRGPSPGLRFTVYALVSLTLMYLDQRRAGPSA